MILVKAVIYEKYMFQKKVECATWWVSPELLRNSNDLSGYVCDMSPGGCFALRAGKKND